MSELIAILVLVAALVAVLFYHATEAAAWRAERRDLLNRVMAKNYTDYVYAKPSESVEIPQMYTDADEVAWHKKHAKENPELYPDDANMEAIV